jgi:hypothetical protein
MDVNNVFMAEDELVEQGLFIDDIHRLRILDPSLADQTKILKTECDQFLQSKCSQSISTEELITFFPFLLNSLIINSYVFV